MTRALVIDDDDIARELMVSVLRNAGYEAFALPSPIGAMQLILRADIEVVVLDVMLPAVSGDQLAKMLRSNPRTQNLAIVLVSSSGIDDLQKLTTDGRVDGVIAKRDVRQSLLAAVEHAHAVHFGELKRVTTG